MEAKGSDKQTDSKQTDSSVKRRKRAAAEDSSSQIPLTVASSWLQLAMLRDLALQPFGGEWPHRDLDFIEVFAGEAAISKGLRSMHKVGATLDLRMDSSHNMLTPCGFVALLACIARLRPGGLLWLAPPCSTWVFMSRTTTGRHIKMSGNWDSSPYILGQNALCCRMAGACLLADSRDCTFIVEQPVSSLMFDYTPWYVLLQGLRSRIKRVNVHLGAFGAASPKLTKLVGTAAWLPSLHRSMQESDWVRIRKEGVSTTVKHEDGRVSGSKDLKASQTYPLEFGAAVAVAFTESSVSKSEEPEASASNPTAAEASVSDTIEQLFTQNGDAPMWHVDATWFLRDLILDVPWDAHVLVEQSLPLE